MSGILNGLGGAGGIGEALRTAGGVVSPEVYDQQNRERDIAMNRLQQLQSQLVSAVQNGAADPQALTKVGIPPGLVGPSPQAQAAKESLMADQRLREAIKGKSFGTSADDMMKVLSDAGMDNLTGPMGEKLLSMLQQRQAKEAAIQQKYDAMEQAKELAKERMSDQRLTNEQRQAEAARWHSLEAQLKMMDLNLKQQGLDLKRKGSEGGDFDASNSISLARTGMPRSQIIAGWGKDAGAKWQKVIDGSIEQIMSENPGLTRDAAAKQFAAEQQGYKATGMAITQNTKDLAAIRPYVDMLDKNANIAIDLSKKIEQSNSKFANKSINWLKQNAGDNPDTAEYLAQMRFVQTEAARVLANPRLVGQLTDSARHEMEQVISGDMPLNSAERVLKRIMADGKNRLNSMVDERERLMKGEVTTPTAKPNQPSTDKDKAAIAWAKANPNDPRAKKILELNGGL